MPDLDQTFPDHLKPADREGLAREILLAHVRATCEPEDIRDAESGRWHVVELTGEDALAAMLEFAAALPPEAERVEDCALCSGDGFSDAMCPVCNLDRRTPATPAEQPDQRAGEVERLAGLARDVLAWRDTGNLADDGPLESYAHQIGYSVRRAEDKVVRDALEYLAALHPSQESRGVEGEAA